MDWCTINLAMRLTKGVKRQLEYAFINVYEAHLWGHVAL